MQWNMSTNPLSPYRDQIAHLANSYISTIIAEVSLQLVLSYTLCKYQWAYCTNLGLTRMFLSH